MEVFGQFFEYFWEVFGEVSGRFWEGFGGYFWCMFGEFRELFRRKTPIRKIGKPKQNHLIHLCGSGEPNVAQMMEFMKK